MNTNKSKIDLNTLRQNIDLIDLELLELIKKRFEVVLDVWKFKLENNVSPLQQSRWDEVLDDKLKKSKDMGLDEIMIREIWNSIHNWALRLEKSIINKGSNNLY